MYLSYDIRKLRFISTINCAVRFNLIPATTQSLKLFVGSNIKLHYAVAEWLACRLLDL